MVTVEEFAIPLGVYTGPSFCKVVKGDKVSQQGQDEESFGI